MDHNPEERRQLRRQSGEEPNNRADPTGGRTHNDHVTHDFLRIDLDAHATAYCNPKQRVPAMANRIGFAKLASSVASH